MIAGSISLYIPEADYELFAIEGQVDINIITIGEDPNKETRLILDASGDIRVAYLGTIATAAAQFVLVDPANAGLQFWGVATLDINPSKLIKFGLEFNVFAQLNINTTDAEKTETLAMQVMQSDYSDDFASLDTLHSLLPTSLKKCDVSQSSPR